MQPTKLIILGGFAGAGKTTIAKRLSAEYNYPLFSSDEISDAVRPLLKLEFHESMPVSYGILWYLLRKHLENGVTCVVDSNMAGDMSWKRIDEIKQDLPDVRVLPILLTGDLEMHKQRIEHRGKTNLEHLNLGGDAFEDTVHKYDYLKDLDRDDLVRIDATGSIDEVYEKTKAATGAA